MPLQLTESPTTIVSFKVLFSPSTVGYGVITTAERIADEVHELYGVGGVEIDLTDIQVINSYYGTYTVTVTGAPNMATLHLQIASIINRIAEEIGN